MLDDLANAVFGGLRFHDVILLREIPKSDVARNRNESQFLPVASSAVLLLFKYLTMHITQGLEAGLIPKSVDFPQHAR